MKNLNLSRWALEHKSLVVYLMLVVALAGLMQYGKLGREEDPPFTIKTMVVKTLWPGATTLETVQQVTDRIEKKLEELPNLDYLKSYSKPGESVVFVTLKDASRASDVPDLWYQARKKVGDIKQTLPQGVQGPFFNDEFGDTYSLIFALTADGFSHRELRDHAERLRGELLQRSRRCQDRPHRHAGREDLSRVLHPAARGHGARHFQPHNDAAGAERHPAERHRRCRSREDRHPRFWPIHVGRKPQGDQLPRQRPLLPPERYRQSPPRLRRPAAANVPIQRHAGDRPCHLHGQERQCARRSASTSRSGSPS